MSTPPRTEIVATIGPASQDRSTIEAMIRAGADMFRLGMCNGTREQHASAIRSVREVAAEQGRTVEILADLQGRKNRVGALPNGQAHWAIGDLVEFTYSPCEPTSHRTWTKHRWPGGGVQPGSNVLIDDGALLLTVEEVGPASVTCRVVQGGTVTSGRGVTIPGLAFEQGALTQTDVDDLRFAVSMGVEVLALSFAYAKTDADEMRALAPDCRLLAKVEHSLSVDALPSLIAAFDGVMVARGDLAIEVPYEDVPFIQKQIVAACRAAGKPAMVATQLLYTMQRNSRPSRAEVSDVANAVLDGASSLLLAGETGFGSYPAESVAVLRRIARRAEEFVYSPEQVAS